MKITYKLILFTFLIGSFNMLAQESFPKSWEGKYSGNLEIYGVDSVAMKLKMKLDISKKTDSIYQWKIMYDFKGKVDIRDYELVVVDTKRGIYKIDEKNSIEIGSYYKSGIFTSFFEVMNSFIISTYSKVEDNIVFEIISGDGKNTSVSGNTKLKNEDIPEVTSYLVNGRQKAVLKRISALSN